MSDTRKPNPPYDASRDPRPPVPFVDTPVRGHKKKSVLHSHEATRPAGSEAMGDINITPLIDVMLVLLIIFMVITPMLQKGVDVKLPVAANTKERKDEQKSVTLAIKKDSTTFLNGVKLEQKDLIAPLKEKLEDMPEGGKMIYLKADQDLAYSEVMKVMDLAREAGVEEIALIAEARVQS